MICMQSPPFRSPLRCPSLPPQGPQERGGWTGIGYRCSNRRLLPLGPSPFDSNQRHPNVVILNTSMVSVTVCDLPLPNYCALMWFHYYTILNLTIPTLLIQQLINCIVVTVPLPQAGVYTEGTKLPRYHFIISLFNKYTETFIIPRGHCNSRI